MLMPPALGGHFLSRKVGDFSTKCNGVQTVCTCVNTPLEFPFALRLGGTVTGDFPPSFDRESHNCEHTTLDSCFGYYAMSYYNQPGSGSSNEYYEVECAVWVEQMQIGRGGFGKVTLWKNQNDQRLMVIKEFLAPSVHSFTDEEQRFMDEARMVMKLNHRNVVTAIDLSQEDSFSRAIDQLHLCMEYCEGGDLRQVLLRPEHYCGLTEGEMRTVSSDIAAGIQFLHCKGITHRDLKPENILLKREEGKTVYKLSDFGYAKEAESNKLQSIVGTLPYAAPEVLRVSNRHYRRSVDCWSFGIVVFECACGRRPFFHDDIYVEALSLVEKKSGSNIYITKKSDGTVEYVDSLPRPHQLSSPLVKSLEGWFRKVLEVNPVSRGGTECLQMLKTVVERPTVNVFNMSTSKTLSYFVEEVDLVRKLEHQLMADCQTGGSGGYEGGTAMFLLLEDGQLLTNTGGPTAACKDGPMGHVFMFSEQQICIRFCSNNERPIQKIISGEVRKVPGKEKKLIRGQALFAVVRRSSQFSIMAKGLEAACQFIEGLKNERRSMIGVEEMCTEVKARCTLLLSSWEMDRSELESVLQKSDEDQPKSDLSTMWRRRVQKLNEIVTNMRPLKEECTSLQEMFDQQCREALERLKLTIHQIKVVTQGWMKEGGSLQRAKKLFQELKSNSSPSDPKEEEFQTTLVDVYSQCGELTTILSKWNFYSDLFELLRAVTRLRDVSNELRDYSKEVNEMQEKRQKELWMMIKGKQTSESTYALRPLPYNRTSSASPTSDIPNPITSTPWPFQRHSPPAHSSSVPNGSGGYYRPMIHPQSEPQRQMSDIWFSRRIYTSEEEHSAGAKFEASLQKFERIRSSVSSTSSEEISSKFTSLLAYIKLEQDTEDPEGPVGPEAEDVFGSGSSADFR